MTAASLRQPVVFLPHGGGPWPFVPMGLGSPQELTALSSYLRRIPELPSASPKALLVISAHWEEAVPTVTSGEAPTLLFDYHGFPPEAYTLSWPAPGEPTLARRVRDLLGAAGVASAENAARGFDHGTFVPLKLSYPDAALPTVQLSLKAGLDPSEHLAIGRALSPLRDEGVFIIGSGMTFHNLRAFGTQGKPAAAAFDGWLRQVATLPASERDQRLIEWAQAPSARLAHPREEHLLPLMVIAGAAGADRGRVGFAGSLLGLALSGYEFGAERS